MKAWSLVGLWALLWPWGIVLCSCIVTGFGDGLALAVWKTTGDVRRPDSGSPVTAFEGADLWRCGDILLSGCMTTTLPGALDFAGDTVRCNTPAVEAEAVDIAGAKEMQDQPAAEGFVAAPAAILRRSGVEPFGCPDGDVAWTEVFKIHGAG
mmetsp:Transcript_84411/g.149319  ORF Transcript_84411/g.149319 Transcript_84411/m.149319 type:complete len:152 (-) Transcript_84411:761-1216(-)